MTNEENLSKALQTFKKKYPSVTSADLQTFILGWKALESVKFIPLQLDKAPKAIARKRTPCLGICNVNSIDFESNKVDLSSPQNGISTIIDITENEVVFLPFTGSIDMYGNKIYPGDLIETPMHRALNRPPSPVVFINGTYKIEDITLTLFEIAEHSIRHGSIYDNPGTGRVIEQHLNT